ncbi:MAG: hypothetical protein WD804_04810 [Gemmatimonadota bacterium]
MRRALALVVLAALLGSKAEAVVGELRDGDVHHETTAKALAHQQDPHGAHAHDAVNAGDEGGPVSDGSADGGQDHEHGSSSDHCTHVHGAAAIGSTDTPVPPNEVSFDFRCNVSNFYIPSESLYPPPRQ